MTDKSVAANGTHVRDGIPIGVTSVTPYIAVPDVRAAAAFLEAAFDARTLAVTERDGRAVHAHLDMGHGRIHLEAENPGAGLVVGDAAAPTVAFAFACADVDATLERALAAGAALLAPAIDFASGDRFAAITDPSGVRWSIVTRIDDVSEDESAERVARWAAEQAS